MSKRTSTVKKRIKEDRGTGTGTDYPAAVKIPKRNKI